MKEIKSENLRLVDIQSLSTKLKCELACLCFISDKQNICISGLTYDECKSFRAGRLYDICIAPDPNGTFEVRGVAVDEKDDGRLEYVVHAQCKLASRYVTMSFAADDEVNLCDRFVLSISKDGQVCYKLP